MNDGGKGATPRPFEVEYEKFLSNWELTFRKKPEALESQEKLTETKQEQK